MILRRIGVGMTAFIAVTLVGVIVMQTWSRARRVEHRVRVRVADPARAQAVRELILRRADTLTSLYALTSFTAGEPDGEGRMVLTATVDQASGLQDSFFAALISVGRMTFAVVLEDGQQAPDGAKVREVTYSRQLFSLRDPTEHLTETKTYRVLDPPAMVVREPVQCEYHTEGMMMEPVLNIRMQGDDAVVLWKTTMRYEGRLLALLIGGRLATLARVTVPIEDGRIQLRKLYDRLTIKRLKELLEIGPLPCAVHRESSR